MSNIYKSNDKKTSIMSDDKKIKYPFIGQAPNLIDSFLVLGYDQKTIDFTYQNCNIKKPNYKTYFTIFEFEERPEVINEICNDYSKDLLDNDLILELIFPNYPRMYFLAKEYINLRKEKEIDDEYLINPYFVIFSINPQNKDGSKKSYNGLGYIFYDFQEHKANGIIDGYLYIPIAYVILSEYPYFFQFNKICKNIYIQMKKESDQIPFEIIIYNTIKFVPSPINRSINLLFGNEIGIRQNKNIEIEKILFNLDSKSKKDKIGIPSMFFNQLLGFPTIDFNMSFIFNLIPPEIILEVFIFSFLEHNIIFYSTKLDFLNIVMYIFKCFNYPFNDSDYYQYILSVSQENFMSEKSSFIDKKSPTMIGILSEYDPEFLTTEKIGEHFVLDIDNKNFFFIYKEKNDEIEDIIILHNYIKECSEDIFNYEKDSYKYERKNIFNDEIHLYECISFLMEELIKISRKVTSIDYNLAKLKPNFFNLYKNESEVDCIKSNNNILRAFYLFIIKIIRTFPIIKNYNKKIKEIEEKKEKKEKLNDSKSENIPKSRVPSFVINIMEEEEENQEQEQEEKIQMEEIISQLKENLQLGKKSGEVFKEKFMNTLKYNSFFIKFCLHGEANDVNNIPYTFINLF